MITAKGFCSKIFVCLMFGSLVGFGAYGTIVVSFWNWILSFSFTSLLKFELGCLKNVLERDSWAKIG